MGEEKTIVLFQGQSQYFVLNAFINEIAGVFSELGYDTAIIWLTKTNWQGELEEILKTKKVAFFFSFNAIGIDIQMNHESLYDHLHIPLFAFLVDHPMYHLQRLNTGVKNLIVSCVDQDHVLFLRKYLNGHYTKVFIPHGVMVKQPDPHLQSDRPIDVLFSGTFHDPENIRKTWTSCPTSVSKLCEEIIDQSLYEVYQPLDQIVLKVFESKGIDPGYIVQSSLYKLLMQIDQYIRYWRRKRALEQLSHTDFRIEVYGNGWESLSKKIPGIRFYPAMSYEKIKAKMGKSKLVLTVMPNFTYGGHERVFSAMSQGAVSLVNDNGFFRDNFKQEELLTYSVHDDLGIRIENLLKNRDKLQQISEFGRTKVIESHTWLNRAQKIIQTVDYHQYFMNND
ncbi:glycosyltransferase [Sporolactobacillus sp. KGMB 08714]|uniref:glycosyltransferase n=1 Tax=Sporolactobacillus sp. KGMB 08714 TaxID=3064704 RepID=UPI002FBD50F9